MPVSDKNHGMFKLRRHAMLICVIEQTSCKSKTDTAPPNPEPPLRMPDLSPSTQYLPYDCLVYSREQYDDHTGRTPSIKVSPIMCNSYDKQ